MCLLPRVVRVSHDQLMVDFAVGVFLPTMSAHGTPGNVAAARLAAAGRAELPLTTNTVLALRGDPDLPDRATVIRALADPDGMFGIPAEQAENMLVYGDSAAVAGPLAAFAAEGVRRVVVTLPGGDSFRQTEPLGQAVALL